MIDPRAALADVMLYTPPEHVADALAERGVRLVTLPELQAAEAMVDMGSFWIHESQEPDDPPDMHRMRFDHAGYMAAIFAALSGEATE